MLAWCCCWRDWWWARLTTGPHTTDSPRGQSAGPSLSPPASRSSSPAEPGCLCWARGSRAMLRGAESALLPLSLRSVALMGRRTGEVLTRHLPTITRQSSSAGTPVSWSWSPAGSTGTSGWWVPGPALRTVPGSSWGCTLAGVSLGPVTRDTVTTTSSGAARQLRGWGCRSARSGRAARPGEVRLQSTADWHYFSSGPTSVLLSSLRSPGGPACRNMENNENQTSSSHTITIPAWDLPK